MIAPDVIRHVTELCNKPVALGGWLGLPYEKDGCLKFAIRFYKELGIEATDQIMREARYFIEVDQAQFGDMAIFHYGAAMWHVGVMLDHRRMIQCSGDTCGVGKVPVDIYPWAEMFRGFRRHKDLNCF